MKYAVKEHAKLVAENQRKITSYRNVPDIWEWPSRGSAPAAMAHVGSSTVHVWCTFIMVVKVWVGGMMSEFRPQSRNFDSANDPFNVFTHLQVRISP